MENRDVLSRRPLPAGDLVMSRPTARKRVIVAGTAFGRIAGTQAAAAAGHRPTTTSAGESRAIA